MIYSSAVIIAIGCISNSAAAPPPDNTPFTVKYVGAEQPGESTPLPYSPKRSDPAVVQTSVVARSPIESSAISGQPFRVEAVDRSSKPLATVSPYVPSPAGSSAPISSGPAISTGVRSSVFSSSTNDRVIIAPVSGSEQPINLDVGNIEGLNASPTIANPSVSNYDWWWSGVTPPVGDAQASISDYPLYEAYAERNPAATGLDPGATTSETSTSLGATVSFAAAETRSEVERTIMSEEGSEITKDLGEAGSVTESASVDSRSPNAITAESSEMVDTTVENAELEAVDVFEKRDVVDIFEFIELPKVPAAQPAAVPVINPIVYAPAYPMQFRNPDTDLRPPHYPLPFPGPYSNALAYQRGFEAPGQEDDAMFDDSNDSIARVVRIRSCPSDMQLQGDLCVGLERVPAKLFCPPSTDVVDNECVASRMPFVDCPVNYDLIANECVYREIIPAEPICAPDYDLDEETMVCTKIEVGNLECPSNAILAEDNRTCLQPVPKQMTCEDGFSLSTTKQECVREILKRAQPVCPAESELRDAPSPQRQNENSNGNSEQVCVLERQPPQHCPDGFVFSRMAAACIKPVERVDGGCPPDFTRVGAHCEKTEILPPEFLCPLDHELTAANECVTTRPPLQPNCGRGLRPSSFHQGKCERVINEVFHCPEGSYEVGSGSQLRCRIIEEHDSIECCSPGFEIDQGRCRRVEELAPALDCDEGSCWRTKTYKMAYACPVDTDFIDHPKTPKCVRRRSSDGENNSYRKDGPEVGSSSRKPFYYSNQDDGPDLEVTYSGYDANGYSADGNRYRQLYETADAAPMDTSSPRSLQWENYGTIRNPGWPTTNEQYGLRDTAALDRSGTARNNGITTSSSGHRVVYNSELYRKRAAGVPDITPALSGPLPWTAENEVSRDPQQSQRAPWAPQRPDTLRGGETGEIPPNKRRPLPPPPPPPPQLPLPMMNPNVDSIDAFPYCPEGGLVENNRCVTRIPLPPRRACNVGIYDSKRDMCVREITAPIKTQCPVGTIRKGVHCLTIHHVEPKLQCDGEQLPTGECVEIVELDQYEQGGDELRYIRPAASCSSGELVDGEVAPACKTIRREPAQSTCPPGATLKKDLSRAGVQDNFEGDLADNVAQSFETVSNKQSRRRRLQQAYRRVQDTKQSEIDENTCVRTAAMITPPVEYELLDPSMVCEDPEAEMLTGSTCRNTHKVPAAVKCPFDTLVEEGNQCYKRSGDAVETNQRVVTALAAAHCNEGEPRGTQCLVLRRAAPEITCPSNMYLEDGRLCIRVVPKEAVCPTRSKLVDDDCVREVSVPAHVKLVQG